MSACYSAARMVTDVDARGTYAIRPQVLFGLILGMILSTSGQGDSGCEVLVLRSWITHLMMKRRKHHVSFINVQGIDLQ